MAKPWFSSIYIGSSEQWSLGLTKGLYHPEYSWSSRPTQSLHCLHIFISSEHSVGLKVKDLEQGLRMNPRKGVGNFAVQVLGLTV